MKLIRNEIKRKQLKTINSKEEETSLSSFPEKRYIRYTCL